MSSLFYLFLLLILLFSTNTKSLNSTSLLDRTISNGETPLPIDTVFNFPSPIPAWSKGQGFASNAIDIGGLQLKQIKSFNKIWRTYEGGPNGIGATFFEPSEIPDGFFMLGSYAQSNSKALFGSVLVAKDLTNDALKQPVDYTLVWSSVSANVTTKDNISGFIWRPTPPNGYVSVGYIVTNSPEKPTISKIRCVKSDFADSCENDAWIWGAGGINFYNPRPSVRGIRARGLSPGTFIAQNGEPGNVISCLKNLKNDFPYMPDEGQIIALVKEFSPLVYFHGKEEFFPASLAWFWDNRALLYKKEDEANPVKVDPNGSNLPRNGSGDGSYWMDLPRDEGERDMVRKGDLNSAATYLHIKPVFGATYTDIVIWLFYPFNGNARIGIMLQNLPKPIEISLGEIGEHVGDWEHVTLRISNFDGELKSVYFSQHKKGIWVSAADLQYKDNKVNKFLTFACRHSHALEPQPTVWLYEKLTDHFGLLKQAEMSNMFLDTGLKYEVISAEYLGSGSTFVEPSWLSYVYEWGPTLENKKVTAFINKIIDRLPKIMRPKVEQLVTKLPRELVGQEGPVGPRWKSSWDGDEDLNSDGTINSDPTVDQISLMD